MKWKASVTLKELKHNCKSSKHLKGSKELLQRWKAQQQGMQFQ